MTNEDWLETQVFTAEEIAAGRRGLPAGASERV
jgi:hypothetical protein